MAFLIASKIPLVIFLLIQVCAAIEHNLPEGLEIVDPKSLGLAGADLDKFLGNVKLLPVSGNGLGAKEGTKTQILTVGFEGDEGINLDDFELPSVDSLPDSEKDVAKAAFSRFKDFFKDPTKSKTIVHDEDLNEDPFNGDIKKLIATSTTTTPTASTLTTSSSRGRTVYRPRTTTPATTTKTTTTRVRKIKRPGSFRRITTTPLPATTDYPEELLQGINAGDSKRIVEFKPEMFQDYAKIIKDLQSMGPRSQLQGQPQQDADEGAPIGLLGFKQVTEPGHKGPPIFEFGGSSSPIKPRNKPISTTRPAASIRETYTTTKPTTTGFPSQTRYLSNRPHGNVPLTGPSGSARSPSPSGSSRTTSPTGSSRTSSRPTSPNRFSSTPKLISRPEYQPEPLPVQDQIEPVEPIAKTAFEQISAMPIGSVHHTSIRVPFRFPNDEEKQTQYEQIYEHHVLTEAQRQQRQQQLQQQQPTIVPLALPQIMTIQPQAQIIRPTILAPAVHYTQQLPFNGFTGLPQPDQIQFIQQEYQRQQHEQQRKLQQLQEQLKLQQQQRQQLEQQLKIQNQQRQQQQSNNPPPQQTSARIPFFPQQSQTQIHFTPQQSNFAPQQSQINFAPQPSQINFATQQSHFQPQSAPSQFNYKPQPVQSQYKPQQSQINYKPQQSQINYKPQPAQNTQINFQPQSSAVQTPVHNHQQYRPTFNANTIRPETFSQSPNFRPNVHQKFPADNNEKPRNPFNLFGPDAKPPQLIPISTIENALRPNNPYSPHRFAPPSRTQQLPHQVPQQSSHQVSHQQPSHQVPQSSHQVHQFTQRPQQYQQQSPYVHHSQQFGIRSSGNNADANSGRAEGPTITSASLIGTFSISPQHQQQKVTTTAL